MSKRSCHSRSWSYSGYIFPIDYSFNIFYLRVSRKPSRNIIYCIFEQSMARVFLRLVDMWWFLIKLSELFMTFLYCASWQTIRDFITDLYCICSSYFQIKIRTWIITKVCVALCYNLCGSAWILTNFSKSPLCFIASTENANMIAIYLYLFVFNLWRN